MLHCLVIDDNSNNCTVARYIMEDMGFNVHTAENVEDSLKYVASNDCDVILLDWMMPDIDGIDFLELLRESDAGKQIKVIMCTAKQGDANREHALKAGADAYVVKPLTLQNLGDALNEVGIEIKGEAAS